MVKALPSTRGHVRVGAARSYGLTTFPDRTKRTGYRTYYLPRSTTPEKCPHRMAERHMDRLAHHHHTGGTQGLRKDNGHALWASRHLAKHNKLAFRASYVWEVAGLSNSRGGDKAFALRERSELHSTFHHFNRCVYRHTPLCVLLCFSSTNERANPP